MPWIHKDYTGKKFGKWTLLHREEPKRPIKYLCRCECGFLKTNHLENLKRGLSTQCINCAALQNCKKRIGERWSYLTIIDAKKIDGISKLIVKCDCGNIRELNNGIIKKYKSCGLCHLTKNNNFLPLIGSSRGLLQVLSYDSEKKKYLCLCKCGNKTLKPCKDLKKENCSCGCFYKNQREQNAKRLVGMKYFYLKIMKFLGMKENLNGKKRAAYKIKCKCGSVFDQSISYLFGSRSCGCLQKEKIAKGSRSGNSKLTESEVKAMRELSMSKMYTKKELSEMFRISYANACAIIKGSKWTHVEMTK